MNEKTGTARKSRIPDAAGEKTSWQREQMYFYILKILQEEYDKTHSGYCTVKRVGFTSPKRLTVTKRQTRRRKKDSKKRYQLGLTAGEIFHRLKLIKPFGDRLPKSRGNDTVTRYLDQLDHLGRMLGLFVIDARTKEEAPKEDSESAKHVYYRIRMTFSPEEMRLLYEAFCSVKGVSKEMCGNLAGLLGSIHTPRLKQQLLSGHRTFHSSVVNQHFTANLKKLYSAIDKGEPVSINYGCLERDGTLAPGRQGSRFYPLKIVVKEDKCFLVCRAADSQPAHGLTVLRVDHIFSVVSIRRSREENAVSARENADLLYRNGEGLHERINMDLSRPTEVQMLVEREGLPEVIDTFGRNNFLRQTASGRLAVTVRAPVHSVVPWALAHLHTVTVTTPAVASEIERCLLEALRKNSKNEEL